MTKRIQMFGAFGLMCTPLFGVQAADDPPTDVAATVSADAKAVGTTVKHDAKVVAEAAKEGAQQVAAAAKEVAHEVAVTTKEGAQQVAAAAKRGTAKTKAAVKSDKPDKPGNKPPGAPISKPDDRPLQ